jgi:hypothetical protein
VSRARGRESWILKCMKKKKGDELWELLGRMAPAMMTIEDLEIIWSRSNLEGCVIINLMRKGDRKDAESMFARMDARADEKKMPVKI